MSAYRDAGDLELMDALESRRRELAEAADDEALAALAESCLEAARAAVARPAIASPSSTRSWRDSLRWCGTP